jgi:hypothetical protein
MYTVRAEETIVLNGKTLVRVVIKGQSFLLHQIRIMVASAILVARGVIPLHTIDMALLSPHFINLPMAPAQGLCLVNAGFSKNSNKQDYAMSSTTADAIVSSNSTTIADNLLMNDEENDESERYKRKYIYPQISQDWNEEAVQEWLSFIDRFRVSQEVGDIWSSEVNTLLQDKKIRAEFVRTEETNRIERNIIKFEFQNARLIANSTNSIFPKGDGKKKGEAVKEPVARTFKHKAFLPNTVPTEMIRRFKVNPGVSLQNTLKALATDMAERRIRADSSIEDIIDLVVKNGGIEVWKDKQKHPLIE